MINDIALLLLPIILIAGGYYIKIARDREPYATRNSWKWITLIGFISLVIQITRLITKYT